MSKNVHSFNVDITISTLIALVVESSADQILEKFAIFPPIALPARKIELIREKTAAFQSELFSLSTKFTKVVGYNRGILRNIEELQQAKNVAFTVNHNRENNVHRVTASARFL